ncbi:Transport ATP-binding protein CydD [Clostridiaceae bacterium JG1575]|nr:Transport ATP-binding protein CydD [Clostridiaceae bacterium JG1575]
MMINRRLLGLVPEAKRPVAACVVWRWLALLCQIGLYALICLFLQGLYEGKLTPAFYQKALPLAALALALRALANRRAILASHRASAPVKKTIRHLLAQRLLLPGDIDPQQKEAAGAVQVMVEGADQLDAYFGAYLPQFFYSLLAPLTLFAVLAWVHWPSALLLLLCVPLIPFSIAMVMKRAKKTLSRYWGQYNRLGHRFLENLEGLTTLKLFQADERRAQAMDEEAESFRVMTMKVLAMQLQSITIMDGVAYGGAALGTGAALFALSRGALTLGGALFIILLSAEFFIPLRLLGSYFHMAMNGLAAADRMFELLDRPVNAVVGRKPYPKDADLLVRGLTFAYDGGSPVLQDVTATFPRGAFTALVGESGSGKSTLAALLCGRQRAAKEAVFVGDVPLSALDPESLSREMTLVGYDNHVFKGTVRENLAMGNPKASDSALWGVLQRVCLSELFEGRGGLDAQIEERATNLSGGQKQRLTLARALLHDTPGYIFDEVTANIDVESEEVILRTIRSLARSRTVLFITHRLANVTSADVIHVLDQGRLVESGTHRALLAKDGVYAALWKQQDELESIRREGEEKWNKPMQSMSVAD